MTEENKHYIEEYLRLSAERERLVEERKELLAKLKQRIKEFKQQNRHMVYKIQVIKRKGMRAIQLVPILPKRCLGCKNARCKDEIDMSYNSPVRNVSAPKK